MRSTANSNSDPPNATHIDAGARATHKAVHGDVIGALGTNLFLPVFAVLAVAAWLTWFLPTIDRRPPALVTRAPGSMWVALGASLLLFAVLRNLPYGPLRGLAP